MRRTALGSAVVLALSVVGVGAGPAEAATRNEFVLGQLGPASFAPGRLSPPVNAGDLIEFTNLDLGWHSVTSAAGAFDLALNGFFRSAKINTSGFAAGTYEYYCKYHPMSGSFTVV